MESRFMKAAEVANELGTSVSYAYKMISRLNRELEAKGYLTISGRVSRQYFLERLYGSGKEEQDAGLQR